MAITYTSLASAFGVNDLTFKATSATGATVGGFVKIDDEFSIITEINGVYVTVRSRGDQGTFVKAHDVLAPVTFGLLSDLPRPFAGRSSAQGAKPEFVSYGQNGAIALPYRDTRVLLTKATAAAMTLADPSGVPDGTELTISSATAAAHTVTLTTGFAGSNATDVFTFTAAVGTSIKLIAAKGKWIHVSTSLDASEAAAVAVA